MITVNNLLNVKASVVDSGASEPVAAQPAAVAKPLLGHSAVDSVVRVDGKSASRSAPALNSQYKAGDTVMVIRGGALPEVGAGLVWKEDPSSVNARSIHATYRLEVSTTASLADVEAAHQLLSTEVARIQGRRTEELRVEDAISGISISQANGYPELVVRVGKALYGSLPATLEGVEDAVKTFLQNASLKGGNFDIVPVRVEAAGNQIASLADVEAA
jgi:hypothetical protein